MRPALRALVAAAVDATGAAAGCLFAVEGQQVQVMAVAGEAAGSLVGIRVPAGGTSAGFVVSSGQPMALTVRAGESSNSTLAAMLELLPASVLSVP